MRPRRLPGKTVLAATAVALVAIAGGGAAVWLATSADDEAPQGPLAVATAPETTETEAVPEAPPETPPEPPREAEAEDPRPETVPSEPARRGTRKTRFPGERAETRPEPVQRRFAVPPAREFSGTGNARLGTVDVRQASVVKWKTKGRFELRFGREAFPIIAPTASGRLVVPPYNFDRVRVIATGRWEISITPQR
jgi:hypothetical protein